MTCIILDITTHILEDRISDILNYQLINNEVAQSTSPQAFLFSGWLSQLYLQHVQVSIFQHVKVSPVYIVVNKLYKPLI